MWRRSWLHSHENLRALDSYFCFLFLTNAILTSHSLHSGRCLFFVHFLYLTLLRLAFTLNTYQTLYKHDFLTEIRSNPFSNWDVFALSVYTNFSILFSKWSLACSSFAWNFLVVDLEVLFDWRAFLLTAKKHIHLNHWLSIRSTNPNANDN